jgi:hypothetical protein
VGAGLQFLELIGGREGNEEEFDGRVGGREAAFERAAIRGDQRKDARDELLIVIYTGGRDACDEQVSLAGHVRKPCGSADPWVSGCRR